MLSIIPHHTHQYNLHMKVRLASQSVQTRISICLGDLFRTGSSGPGEPNGHYQSFLLQIDRVDVMLHVITITHGPHTHMRRNPRHTRGAHVHEVLWM